MAKNHVKTSEKPIYFYIFSAESKLNMFKNYLKTNTPGASHTDELGYLFNTIYGPQELEKNSLEEIGMKRMTKLWANFAKYGNPNPKEKDDLIDVVWKPITQDCITYMDIGNSLSIGVNPNAERMAFWDEIYKTNPDCAHL